MISTDASSTKAALTNEPMAKVTSPDGGKQTTNRLDTDWSEQQSRQIASIIRQLTTGWKERSRAAQMLVALCDLVEQEPSRLDPGNDPQVWGFQAMEIGEALQERFNDAGKWATDPVSAKERMSEHWPKLEEIWERQEATILDGLQDAAIEPRPSLHRLAEKGGSGKRNRYGFRFRHPGRRRYQTRLCVGGYPRCTSCALPSPRHLRQPACPLDVRPWSLPGRLGRQSFPQRLRPTPDLHRLLGLAGDRGHGRKPQRRHLP